MINIEFGYGYDQAVEASNNTYAGYLKVGSLGLISLLETQLGLATVDVSFTSRLVQYHKCLKKALNDKRFYALSFQENEFSSARTLLQWRDSLYMGGWTGSFSNKAPQRLKDLSDVETHAKDEVALNMGQRIQRVISLLSAEKTQIASLTITDELELLPPIYCSLFSALESHCKIMVAPIELKPVAEKSTDLSTLQNALISKQQGKKIQLKGDGSFIVLTANAKSVSAQHIASSIALSYKEDERLNYGIIAEHDGQYLDTAFDQIGALRAGNSEESPWRPSFQVLPLCFEILWSPLNPYALLEFLSHPVGPIPKRMRENLADVVASYPGIGNEHWNETITNQLAEIAKTDEEFAKRCANAVDTWIPTSFFDPEAGMPISEALERAQKLNDWFIGMNAQYEGKLEQPLYAAAMNQVKELVLALKDLNEEGSSNINRENLRHLITEVRGSGTPLVDNFAESNLFLPACSVYNSPAAMCEPQEIVIWWACENYSAPKKLHWSKKELVALEEENVFLWQTKHQLSLEAKQWLRPILLSEKQVILVLHPDEAQHHPILDNIAARCEGWQSHHCESTLLENSSIHFGDAQLNTKKQLERIPHRSLPLPKRWWQLPKGVSLPKRETESYSSLDKFINSPYQWVLNYQAKLHASSIAEISDGTQLKGNVSHKLFENYFNAFPDLSCTGKKLISWAEKSLSEILEKEGAVLLMPGRQAEMLDFKAHLVQALEKLIAHLKTSKIKSVNMEYEQKGSFVGGKLNGSIDMLAVNEEGKEVVLDIKWAGYKYKKSDLENDHYLQLAIYGAMRKIEAKQWPALAYYIVSDARLLCNEEFYFPDADYVPPASDESVAAFWKRFTNTWKWRREQIDQGLIEVTTSNTEADAASVAPEDCLKIPEASDQYNNYAALTGMGDSL